MNSILGFLLAVGVVSAAPAVAPCVGQTVTVTNQWSLPLSALSANSNCDFKINIPNGFFAIVEVNANNVGYYDQIYMNDDFGNSVRKMSKENTFSSNVAWPGSLNVDFSAQQETNMQVSIKVTVKQATPNANIAGQITTSTNGPSALIYFQDWAEGTSYTLTSANSKVDLKHADTSKNAADSTQYNNIFVYDGGVLVGTLNSVSSFNSNRVTLYLAKKVTLRGAILLTDETNLVNINRHYVVYAPVNDDQKTQTHLVSGDDNMEGALTIIGDKNGATPIDIKALRNLDDLNGSYTVVNGGPLAAHPQAVALTPRRLAGNVNTIFLSRGRGTVQYSTTGQ